MLLPIAGKPLVLHTVMRAIEAAMVDEAIVATDDERIRDVVVGTGFRAIMTSPDHQSGSDRIAEVARELPEGSIIVNVQGDEPVISPKTIDSAVEAMLESDADIVTAWEPVRSKQGELLNGNVVKVVMGADGNAIYFSRSPMPFPREAAMRHGGDPGRAIDEEPELLGIFRKHVGIYVYRREYLLAYTKLPPTRLEQIEMLEQLRALENGAKIKVVEAASSSIGVDTQEDLDRVRDIIEAGIDIRPATREDLPRVAAVHVESWQRSFEGIAPENYLRSMTIERRLKAYSDHESNGPYQMMVAEHPEKGIVGFGDFGTPKLPGGFDAQIYSFYFLPEFQRKGLGSRLFRRCVERIKRDGHRSLCLDSLEVSPYRAFYEKMGGKIVGSDRHKLGDEYFETVVYGWENIEKIADSQ
jgi:3-deoxy-manno-octulosonate cytidylyltransferase (CMP-KDO synthetase)